MAGALAFALAGAGHVRVATPPRARQLPIAWRLTCWPHNPPAASAGSGVTSPAGTFMQHRLEAMTVEVANERRVVVRIVVLANTGSAFVDAAHAQGRGVEAIDGVPTRGGEGQVKAAAGRSRLGTAGERGLAGEPSGP